jgi:hypothetical protein
MSRQVKNPSLAEDLLVLGDIYLALGWIAIKRLRYGPLWPWEPRPHQPVVTLLRPPEEAVENSDETMASGDG